MMPQRTGLEALEGLRKLHGSNRLPVIMVTARDESAAISKAIEAGANDYVAKPIDFAVLQSRLAGVVSRRQDVARQDDHAAELEHLVQLRTAALSQSNVRLREEIAERRAAEARANHLARADAMTSLANRLNFMERLRSRARPESGSGEPFAVVQVDIDRFRSINSVHGPDIGDGVLREMTVRLQQIAKDSELVARTAANEFSILLALPDDETCLRRFAEQVLAACCQPMSIFGRSITPSVSIGAAQSGPLPCEEAAILIECDAAMRSAQREGGGCIYVFDETLGAKIREQIAIKAELTEGIPRGEIIPYFQPTVDFKTGKVVGVEVLARWQHPVRGLVSPALFIPAAEETGQVDDLFWAMLPLACKEALRFGPDMHIAVNLSPSQVLDQWFPQKVLRALAENGFNPAQLEIEMTETALFADLNATKAALESLRNQGVGVALDDFGVGYSSLSLLRELPITKVKIDRSFVMGILEEESSQRLVRGIIDLCSMLDLIVTAEGIEDGATALRLAEWGCQYGQGYWLGRPAPEIVIETPWGSTGKQVAA
jgi:diguanylate cyclase (GGDEF)-like protein